MLNIVIPMAGHGARFASVGYDLPKPLIDVHGTPMIEVVINNLRPACAHRFIFVCLRDHLRGYPLHDVLNRAAPGSAVIGIDGVTDGAACTVLLAREFIDTGNPLMIANCDQWIDYSMDQYLAGMPRAEAGGLIMTMTSSAPKWSYVRRDAQGCVVEVVEKQVVSDEATTGIYNFSHGADFVGAADEMIQANDRVRGEFYVAPVYTRLAQRGAVINTVRIGTDQEGMYGLGTPDDLTFFLRLGFENRLRAERNRARRAA